MQCIRTKGYQLVSEFYSGRIMAYKGSGLSLHDIATRIGQNPTIVQKGHTEYPAGSQRPSLSHHNPRER
ncbi:hypothetical protein TNCV_4311301 [Trichonephila clavipes]|nr:hypothetical protein TNCV_4311301 [Trichonephila clavipes]